MFFHYAARKTSPSCKTSNFFEDLSFLNPKSYLKESILYDIWKRELAGNLQRRYFISYNVVGITSYCQAMQPG